MNYTLTYSPSAQGWTSFFSYNPDWMIGMNNYFYSFNGGNLYRHNTNEVRNQFYGVNYPSTLQTVINDSPIENKLYKTLSLIGDDPWDITSLSTDLQSGGYIESGWFEEKEASWFSFVRNTNTTPADPSDYPLRSLNGIGRSSTVTGIPSAQNINFAIIPVAISIGTIVSIGDNLYFALPPYTTPVFCGVITNIVVDYVSGNNYITVNTTVTGGNVPPIGTAYFLFIKNQIAESHGILGHYMVVEMENNNTEKVELFVIQSDVIKSFP